MNNDIIKEPKVWVDDEGDPTLVWKDISKDTMIMLSFSDRNAVITIDSEGKSDTALVRCFSNVSLRDLVKRDDYEEE